MAKGARVTIDARPKADRHSHTAIKACHASAVTPPHQSRKRASSPVQVGQLSKVLAVDQKDQGDMMSSESEVTTPASD